MKVTSARKYLSTLNTLNRKENTNVKNEENSQYFVRKWR